MVTTQRPDANPHVAWSMALGISPSSRIEKLYDTTVALRTEVIALRAELARCTCRSTEKQE